ncbi:MAG: competence/damage-inducible protein A [Oligoflexia bacterium]|nr:competence/damage-inducible protein A [Oligoflexia bacterium]
MTASSPTSTPTAPAPTAALIIIGDEILTGKFADQNSPWLIDRCRTLGIELRRVVVIPDDIDLIAAEVSACSAAWDWVFTTGGVGPTHDDVTMAGVAQALGVPLERRAELVSVLKKKMGDKLNNDALRMAEVPVGSVLWPNDDVFFPQVVARNVVIFPGVPKLLHLKFNAVAHRFGGVPAHSLRLVTTRPESQIAAGLRTAQQRWPNVHIGSYPRFDVRPWTVIVILDGRDIDCLAACRDCLAEQLAGSLVQDPA